jgi:CxxC motif-containing protein
MKTKDLTCITCPIGCRISVEITESGLNVTGNTCPRGEEFAKTEMTAPMRSLTTTVRTLFPETPALPVRTNGEIPKEAIKPVMRELSKVSINKRMAIGDVLIENILGTGCDIIVTGDILT